MNTLIWACPAVAGRRSQGRSGLGLAGWSWGILRLHDVAIDPGRDLLAGPGQGMPLFRRHFAAFRPLVAATALGAAAGVYTMVADTLAARARIGVLPRVRDNALITLGRVHAKLYAALLSTVATSLLAARGDPRAGLWARVGKAHAVDTANRAVAELAPLVGAAGFQATSLIVKARGDLAGLLYADGIHDSLYRSGGLSLLPADMIGDWQSRERLRRHAVEEASDEEQAGGINLNGPRES